MIFVSWPVYATKPYINSVFYNEHPRSMKLLSFTGIISFVFVFTCPLNLYKYGFGGSYEKTIISLSNTSFSPSFCVLFGAIFFFKFVSPSRFFVSMKHSPCFPEEYIHSISAGTLSDFSTLTISPTRIYSEAQRTQVLSLNTLNKSLFSLLSESCRFLSSRTSFDMEMKITTTSGKRITGLPSVIDMDLTICMNPMKRK